MSVIPVLFLGDDWVIPVQLTTEGRAEPLTGRTVRAALVDDSGTHRLLGPVECDPGHPQAQVAIGLAVAVFPAASTGHLARGTVLLQVTVDGVGTWLRRTIRIEQSLIP